MNLHGYFLQTNFINLTRNYEREAYDVILQYSSIKAVAWFVNQEISGK